MKLSKKQKEVIRLVRNGAIIHWIGGIYPRCFFSHDESSTKLSTATVLKLMDMKILECDEYMSNIRLTELGKIIKVF